MVSLTRLLGQLSLTGSLVSAAACAGRPRATVQNGTYAGVYSPEYDQDYFLGIPYAQPAERFTLARELNTSWEGVRPATEYSPNCMSYQIEEQNQVLSEDCLYLNVVRPAGVRNDTAPLPVAVWIHGGGLTTGGAAYDRYNLSFIVDRSVEVDAPIIAVSFNYRLNVYGFLSGGEARDAGLGNNGFRDQRLALRWVHENIAAFGGDASKVTIFGESAGAESVTVQLLAFNGRDDGLFRAAIGQSGFGTTIPRLPAGLDAPDDHDRVYRNLVTNTSCADLVDQPGTLDCLRSIPRSELDQALNVTRIGPFPPVLDGDFLQDTPTSQFLRGDFVHVPILIGANTDEGADFNKGLLSGGRLVHSDADMREALRGRIPAQPAGSNKTADTIIDEIMYLYPDIQSVGIPSLDRWPHILQEGDDHALVLGAQYRRTAAFWGDLLMQWARRRSNLLWHDNGLPSWAYRFDVKPNGINPWVGASHFKEVAFVFNNLNGDGMPIDPFGGEEPYVSQAKAVAKEMSTAWVNFVAGLDPNGPSSTTSWPEYDPTDGGGVGKSIVFALEGSYVELDDFRAEGINWLIDNALPVFGN